jgi:hypothetical protein
MLLYNRLTINYFLAFQRKSLSNNIYRMIPHLELLVCAELEMKLWISNKKTYEHELSLFLLLNIKNFDLFAEIPSRDAVHSPMLSCARSVPAALPKIYTSVRMAFL